MRSVVAAGVVALCLLRSVAGAADFTWTGAGYVSGNESTRYWDIAGNWSPSGVPGAGQGALVNISNKYAIANADLAGSPAVEVATGGLVGQKNGVTLTTPVTLSGGTWSIGPDLNYTWGPDRTLNASLTVTAGSRMKGVRGNMMQINGVLAGSGLLTFQSTDSYQGDGPDWAFNVANSTFSGGILLEADNCPGVWANASRALGTGDITVRTTGILRIGANQDYSGAARSPVIYLEGGSTGTRDSLTNATIPFDIVVQSQGGKIAAGIPDGWASNDVYSGSVTLNGPLTLAGSRSHDQVNFTVTGQIAGSFPVTLNTTDQYQGARGIVLLANPNNSFASMTIQMGYLKATSEGALSTGPITLYNPDSWTRLYLDKTPSANWTLTNDITAVGTIQVEDGSTNYTLNCAGSTVTVGTSSATAGTLNVSGNLAFAVNGSTPATVKIDVIGSGSPVVVSNDVLAVSRSVSGLSSANLDVSISGADFVDLAGKTLTILTSTNDLTSQAFAGVTYPAGWKGTLIYGNGFVKLQLSPEGENRPVLDLTPKSLSYSIRASESNPAPASVQVRNVGYGTSHWTAAVRAPGPTWISLGNTSGSDNDSFTVHIDRQGLAAGTYTAYVDVTDAGAANSPQTLAVILQARPDADASTHSFTNSSRGTHPGTLSAAGGNVNVNLSSLPAGTQIFRAILVPHSSGFGGTSGGATLPLKVQAADAPNVWLQAAGPRYLTLDCTAAAQRALLAGDKTLRLNLISYPAGLGSEVRLDVWCDAPAASAVQQVTSLQAVHRSGDTMLTFAEVNPPVTEAAPAITTLNNAKAAMDTPNEIRYRIYRSSQPIDALTVRTAELVDEISPMSGWNWDITVTTTIPTLPMDDLTPSAPGTGIYVRRAQSSGSTYYAVSRAVDGEEDLSVWMPDANSLVAAVTEAAGTGMVLQYDQVFAADWFYENNVTRHYFVKWECPPNWNTPNCVHNYLVAVPGIAANPRPVDVALHCWGGNMDGGYGWWYEANHGALLVATNQIPYDWWTAFHENMGTIRPWANVEGNGGGVCRNYSQNRIWSFVNDFVASRWNTDRNHIMVSGSSMGGSGSVMWGIRAGEKFAYIDSWVGVHIPRLTPTFKGSYADVYGQDSWACLYGDTGLSVWDYWDDNQWLRSHVATDTPFIAFCNGKNDGMIGWQQAWLFASACQETRRPHLFKWGQNDHRERAALPGTLSDRHIDIDIDLNKTLPAFTYCSLDQNPGDGDPGVGDASGMLNGYMLWQPEDLADTAGTWEMTCLLISSAPQATCTVDVTPRRCQAFKPAAGKVCTWTNTDIATGTVIASGTAVVDANGLITIPQTIVSKTKNRIQITVSSLVGDINKDGYVNVGDLQALVAAWGSQKTPPSANWNVDADINADDYVNVGDLQLLVAHWGEHQ